MTTHLKENNMKTQNKLNEILVEAYQAGYKTGLKEDLMPFRIWYEQNESKILALGKPEPLAKNKQTENKCSLCLEETNGKTIEVCDNCWELNQD